MKTLAAIDTHAQHKLHDRKKALIVFKFIIFFSIQNVGNDRAMIV